MTRLPFAGTPAISTRAELEALRAARPVPQVEPHLRPDGSDADETRRDTSALSEIRISTLERRLEKARSGLLENRVKGLVRGKAGHDFGREC